MMNGQIKIDRIIKGGNIKLLQMNHGKRKQLEKQLANLLNKCKMKGPSLLSQSLQYFEEFSQIISRKIMIATTSNNKLEATAPIISSLMHVIIQNSEQATISYIVKKLSILHILLHKSNRKQLDLSLRKCYEMEIGIILQKDIDVILGTKLQKKEGSLSKFYGLIRNLSGSKQKSNSNSGKMKIQNQTQKGAIKQLLKKVVQPFAVYLLKIVQDYDFYWSILTNNKPIDSGMFWKIVNLSKLLGNIAVELHRLCRYFRNDFLGVSVYFNYIICLDVSIYYDTAKNYIERQSDIWCLNLKKNKQNVEDISKLSLQNCQQIFEDQNFNQLKEQIEQVSIIKEKINYIYGNKLLKSWQAYFRRPSKYNFNTKAAKEQKNVQSILLIGEAIKKMTKKKSEMLLKKQNFSCYALYDSQKNQSLIQNQQSFQYNKELNQKSKREQYKMNRCGQVDSQIFDLIQEQSMQIKIQKTKRLKARMNNFIQVIEKSKILNETTYSQNSQITKICIKSSS